MASDGRDRFTETRLALHALAEHVLAAARHAATGRIGLRAAPGGFATPPYPSTAGERTVAVAGTDVVVVDDDGERRAPITTLRAAAELAGVAPGAPSEVYEPSTPLEPDAPLVVHADAALEVARTFAVVDEALAALRRERTEEEPGQVQLWPEHFDLAVTLDEVNYGGSPGDDEHPRPYLYVGPWRPPAPDGGFWNEPFGASVPVGEVADPAGAVAFFREGRSRLG